MVSGNQECKNHPFVLALGGWQVLCNSIEDVEGKTYKIAFPTCNSGAIVIYCGQLWKPMEYCGLSHRSVRCLFFKIGRRTYVLR
jgi:hypothetical protein